MNIGDLMWIEPKDNKPYFLPDHKSEDMQIPNRLIFIWFGDHFPFTAQLAVKSAVRSCAPDEVLLIHQGLNENSEGIPELIRDYGLKLSYADDSWFTDLPEGGDLARDLFRTLKSPASRANLLRIAALYKVGGIYLDTDTITVRNFDSLRHHQGFCGTEYVAMPAALFNSINPVDWFSAWGRLAMREACLHIKDGWNTFRHVEYLYHIAANNAVIGSAPGNPFWLRAFDYMRDLPVEDRYKRFRLGSHLIQKVTGNKSTPDMEVLHPGYFYPLGPEISSFWFKPKTAIDLGEMLKDETLVVHWYNSVEERLKQPINQEFVDLNPDTAFAALCRIHCC
jgi:hypothetical protein